MQINDQGTFYVEGEYTNGEVIMSAGSFEILADADGYKKYCVGYDAATTPNPSGQIIQLGNGHHKDFRYYPYKLSATDIQELTR
jgi:hypothetical protein